MKKIFAALQALVLFCAASAQSGVPGEISTSFVQVKAIGSVSSGTTISRPCMLWLPGSYETDNNEYYPLLIFMHGHGEGGTSSGSNVNALKSIGPLHFLDNGTWNGSATYNGITKKFIVFSFQMPVASNYYNDEVDFVIGQLMMRYRIDPEKIIITGVSGGGQSAVDYAFDLNRTHRPRHILPMSCYATVSSPSIATLVGEGMKVWAFTPDLPSTSWKLGTTYLVDNFNAQLSGSGRLTSNDIGHCCWNNYYTPSYREYFGSQQLNIYEWIIKETNDDSGPVYQAWNYKFAGYITELQYDLNGNPVTSLEYACTTGVSVPIYTSTGNVTASIGVISLDKYGCTPQICIPFNGQGQHFGYSNLMGSTADKHLIINSYGIATTVESCITLAGYVSTGTYGNAGGVCSTSCSTAVYSNAGIVNQGTVLYTSTAGTAKFAGNWADYGFSTTQYGTATRTINIDGNGVILRDNSCPYSGSIAHPGEIPTEAPAEASIRIFPNPVSTHLNVYLGIKREQITIRLYNLNGVLMYQSIARGGNHIIATQKFNKGVYFLRLTNSKQEIIQNKKIIIQ